MNREAIFAALWALAPTAQVTTSGRKLRHWDDLKSSDFPALFQAQGDDEIAAHGNLPPAHSMLAKWWVYAYTDPSQNKTPAEVINPLLDAVEAALAPEPGQSAQTLGGLVDQCYIEGKVETDEGLLGDYSVAIVPIRIKVGG